jgi:4-hydroxy-tetrahydrodipicolinate synthase
MQNATLKGDYAEARRINDTLARLHRAMFLEASPAPAKYALSLLGLCTDEVRLPLVPVQSAEVKKEIEAGMKEAGLL